MKKSLAEFWTSFLNEALPANLEPEAIQALKDVFYSGAKAASMLQRGQTVAEAHARSQKLHQELDEHQQQLLIQVPNSSEHIV